jgi:hypothetical protein
MRKKQTLGKWLWRSAPLFIGLGGLLLPEGASAFEWTLGKTKINLGGYVKLDVLYSRFSDGPVPQSTARDFYVPGTTPIFPIGARQHTYLDFLVKQTRLWLGTNTDFGQHQLGSYVEIDFEAGQIPQVIVISPAGVTATTGTKINTNAYNPAIRRGYITFDNWLFGQDWSTFQNFDVFVDTLDYFGPTDGMVIVRQPQVRYTLGGLQLALETPETTVYPFRGVAASKTDDNWLPDFIARYNLKAGFGSFAFAGLVRQLRDVVTVGGANGSAVGWGGSVSGKIPLFDKDDIRFMFTGGRGLGRYLALAAIGDATVTGSNNLLAVWVLNGYAAYRHVWSDELRSNVFVAGLSGLSLANNLGGTATRGTVSATANLLYTPVTKLTLGVEARFANRTDVTGTNGNLVRGQFSAWYYF